MSLYMRTIIPSAFLHCTSLIRHQQYRNLITPPHIRERIDHDHRLSLQTSSTRSSSGFPLPNFTKCMSWDDVLLSARKSVTNYSDRSKGTTDRLVHVRDFQPRRGLAESQGHDKSATAN